MEDEDAELDFLRRHKRFASEIERSSVDTWMQSNVCGDLESERDAYLFLSRCGHRFGLTMKCNGCKCNLDNLSYRFPRYRCLECRDMELCWNCYIKEDEPNGHEISHRITDMG